MIAAANTFFYSLVKTFRFRATSKAVKTMVERPLVYGSETCFMAELDMRGLNTWERKMLRSI